MKINLPEGNRILYQHLLHLLKAALTVDTQKPQSLRSLRVTFDALKKLLKEIISTDLSQLNEIQMELGIKGNVTYLKTLQLAKRYIPKEKLPNVIPRMHR